MTTLLIAPTSGSRGFDEPVGRVLTPEEYDELPCNPRRELMDGVVQVMATPTPWHQDVVDGLKAALARLVPATLGYPRDRGSPGRPPASQPGRHRGPGRGFQPPGAIAASGPGGGRGDSERASQRARSGASVEPSSLVLAVEVVSPGSESTDREIKPIQYARAGIRHYWRVETDPSGRGAHLPVGQGRGRWFRVRAHGHIRRHGDRRGSRPGNGPR
jgi:Uma2 family endonuclease